MKKLRVKKRSQIQSQVFVYVGALIAISLFLVYAFKFLVTYRSNIYASEMVRFIRDFRNDAEQMAINYGSSQTMTYRNAPSDYDKICFLNLESADLDSIGDPVIKDAFNTYHSLPKDQYKQINIINVFLIKGIARGGFYVPNMKVDDGFFCVTIKGSRFSVVMQGNGDSVTIKPAS